MQLPYKPINVFHRHGGTIVEITGIRHQADKPRGGYSTDYWEWTGRVQWGDGSGDANRETHIDPGCLCSDTPEGGQEISDLCGLMMDYLREHGEWFEAGKHRGWYAHRKERSPA